MDNLIGRFEVPVRVNLALSPGHMPFSIRFIGDAPFVWKSIIVCKGEWAFFVYERASTPFEPDDDDTCYRSGLSML